MKIIFIAVDTLRADHLHCYGYKHLTSPNIDELAEQGLIFLNAYANGIPTTPAFTTIFTGLHSITHRVVSHGGDEFLSFAVPFLPEILRENGFRTCAVDNLYTIKPYFARGYEFYINPQSRSPHLIGADEINREAIGWLKSHYKEDFFLFIHYWDPHSPYLPPEKYRKMFYEGKDPFDPANTSMKRAERQLSYPFFKKWHYDLLGNPTDADYIIAQYDGEIRFVDEAVGELLNVVSELGIEEDVLIVLTSDHGENMTEHDFFFDHQGLYEPTVHIPLIVRYGSKFPNKRIETPVQHIDLMPTILEIAGVKGDFRFDGKSLLPLMSGEEGESEQRLIVSTECTWRAGISIRKGDWKLIKTIDQGLYVTPSKELFNLKKDPLEERNLYGIEKDRGDELELELCRWMDGMLGNRPDLIRVQAEKGLPAKLWVERVIKEMNLSWEQWVERQRYI
ncbi:sulfatase [bacterium]|nr:sulfatase [bacterium]